MCSELPLPAGFDELVPAFPIRSLAPISKSRRRLFRPTPPPSDRQAGIHPASHSAARRIPAVLPRFERQYASTADRVSERVDLWCADVSAHCFFYYCFYLPQSLCRSSSSRFSSPSSWLSNQGSSTC